MLHIQTLIVGQLQTNCHLVWDTESMEAILIDPGDDASYIADTVVRLALRPKAIVATHGHFDHTLAAFELQHIFDIPFYVHPKDEFLLSQMRQTAEHYLSVPVIELPPIPSPDLQAATRVSVGSHEFHIVETPGHTPGGISLYSEKDGVCFTGDTVFEGGAIGDWRHSYSDKQALLSSVQTLLSLPDATILYPGHGRESSVTMEKHAQKGKM